MNNGRFAISVHILTLLADAKEAWVSSDFLSGSININPVLVRKELSNLRDHGLVISKEGKAGGNKLAKTPEQIFMSDVYKAVRQKDLLGKGINAPNPKCDVGKEINKHLDSLYDEAETALLQTLEKKSLSDFHQQFG